MSSVFPEIYLVRHGETAWSASGKHTGRTDIPLTAVGEDAARRIADRLTGISFAAVWSSPSQRAFNTSQLAGFGSVSVKKPELAEWDYGAYEGLTTKQILAERPGWRLFRDGCPRGRKRIGCRREGGCGRRRIAQHRRQRAGVFERAFPESACGALAWVAARGRRAFRAGHGEHQHPRLRARPLGAGHPAVEPEARGLKPTRETAGPCVNIAIRNVARTG